MKKLAIAVTAVAALTGSAHAADMPVKARPIAPVVTAYNWTGCYVGAGGGYGMYNQDISFHTEYLREYLGNETLGGRGWFGTGQVGCDYQVTPSIVIGAFGDGDFSSIKGTFGHVNGGDVDEKLSWSWAVGGRIGWVALPNLLAYVSGGYTQAHFDQIDIGSDASFPATTYHGWFLGSGYEYGLSFMPGLFWKTEYRFADYQAETLFEACVSKQQGCDSNDSINSHKYVQTIRSALVYRFNWH